ncbi:MAG: polysaccharide pyruvyl transferase family protein [Candidatus Peregrinibacteria bacterium]|nr:polysaccharide pyruvyl transferase family protein [Candidatus Peregrinibacteria bacterium]MCB9807863.1 polysaccharide pyruvyl transferase family protein [Candidatus Peribacteria bacterium]
MRIALRRPQHQGNLGDELMVRAALQGLSGYCVDIVTSITTREYDAIIDCCGYAYTDAWGPGNAVRFAQELEHYTSHATCVILLPQTYGPFHNEETRRAMQSIMRRAQHVYARDATSLDWLQRIQPTNAAPISMAPDITVGIKGKAGNAMLPGDIAIIPNVHMFRLHDDRSVYLQFLERVCAVLRDNAFTPFLMMHDHLDDKLIEEFSVRSSLPIVHEEDPVRLKGILGLCKGVVSSRFHGALNALSQGVPVLGTAWSHKFNELFAQYRCPEYLVSPSIAQAELQHIITHMNDTIPTICHAQEEYERQSRAMWSSLHQMLFCAQS